VLRNIDLFLHEFVRGFTKDNIDELVSFVRRFTFQETPNTMEGDKGSKASMNRRVSRISKMSLEDEDKNMFTLQR
jgi:hypothetical protein